MFDIFFLLNNAVECKSTKRAILFNIVLYLNRFFKINNNSVLIQWIISFRSDDSLILKMQLFPVVMF